MEIMEPSMSTFDYPSIYSESTAMLGAALRKNGFDTPIAQFLPVVRSRIRDRRRRLEAFSKGDREYHGWVESRQ
jgi:hypothetical protein